MRKKDVYLVGRWGGHLYANLEHIIKDARAAVGVMDGTVLFDDYDFANYYYKEKKEW